MKEPVFYVFLDPHGICLGCLVTDEVFAEELDGRMQVFNEPFEFNYIRRWYNGTTWSEPAPDYCVYHWSEENQSVDLICDPNRPE